MRPKLRYLSPISEDLGCHEFLELLGSASKSPDLWSTLMTPSTCLTVSLSVSDDSISRVFNEKLNTLSNIFLVGEQKCVFHHPKMISVVNQMSQIPDFRSFKK